MVSLDDAVIAKLKKDGKDFEIYVDPELSLLYKKKDITDISKVLASEYIFENSKKDKVSDLDLKKIFKTTNIYEIAHQILMNGDIQLTASQRKRFLEQKKNAIITYITQNAINPQTMTPHTRQRIEIAMKEARVNIDLCKSTEELISTTIKAIRPLLPIKIEELEIILKVSSIYSSKIIGKIPIYCKNTKSKWNNDGSLELCTNIPSGRKNEFYDMMNSITKGDINIKIKK